MPAPQDQRPAVLVVEDDNTIRESLRELLESEGYSVVEAPDGEAALRILQAEERPSVILLDLFMPVMDGKTFLRHKRANQAIAGIPTIIVSAVAEPVAEDDVRGIVRKPVDVDQLIRTLREVEATVPEPRASSSVYPSNAEEDALFRNFVESVQDYAIFLLDAHGYVHSWNKGAERIKGYTAQEIIGRHFSQFYPPEDVASKKPWRALEFAARNGKYEEEGWRIRKDGTRFFAHVVITAIFDKSGKLTGFGKVTRDLTKRREAETELRRSEERFRTLVSGVKEYAIFGLDQQGNIASWNAGAERLKGYTADEVIGRNFAIFYTADDLAAHKPEHELIEARTTGKYEEEGWRVRKDGSKFLARVLLTPIWDTHGQLLGYTKITRDITEQKESDRISEMLRARDLFLSVVAHELRTPITSLLLQAGTVRRQLSRPLSPEEQHARLLKFFNVSTAQVERLNRLVNDLMEFSRISSEKLRLERTPTDLEETIRSTVEVLEPSAEQAGNVFRVRLAPGIVGFWDRVRIEQVVSNLLTNAIRHAPGTQVEIASHLEGGDAVLEVNDNGPGIPEDKLEAVTQPFIQGESSTLSGGLGIGLFILQRIVAEHKGSVQLANRKPHGLSVRIRLPLNAEAR